MEKVIEIPADAKTVTLELKKNNTFTLRTLLPQIRDAVELVVEDAFETKSMKAVDKYRLRANDGDELLHKLERSRVVEGDFILGLAPVIQRVDPTASLFNGTFGMNLGSGVIQLTVRPPVPDEGD